MVIFHSFLLCLPEGKPPFSYGFPMLMEYLGTPISWSTAFAAQGPRAPAAE